VKTAQNVTKLPAVEPRLETGPVQFGDDWPGLFLRGDYAAPMGFLLKGVLADIRAGRKPGVILLEQMDDLVRTLESADVREKK
jgi:hypothetical protein